MLEHLPMTRFSLDTCLRKQVSDFEMALHQNESEATEAIREAKALCGFTIREAKTHHTTLIRKGKANCASIITEVEVCCITAFRKAESYCAKHAYSIQQLHAEGMQHLEMEAIEEEGRDWPLLPSCLWNSIMGLPPGNPWGTNWPPPIAHGKCVSGHPLEHSPRYLPLERNLPSWSLIQPPLWHPGPPLGPNSDTLPPTMWCPHLSWEIRLQGHLKSHPLK